MNINGTSGTPGLNVNELFNSGLDSIDLIVSHCIRSLLINPMSAVEPFPDIGDANFPGVLMASVGPAV